MKVIRVKCKDAIRYSEPEIDKKKLEDLCTELRKKYPPISRLVGKRAYFNSKKGENYIDFDFEEREKENINKNDLLQIIKKYFPEEKIKVYLTDHMQRMFYWLTYRFYIIPNK